MAVHCTQIHPDPLNPVGESPPGHVAERRHGTESLCFPGCFIMLAGCWDTVHARQAAAAGCAAEHGAIRALIPGQSHEVSPCAKPCWGSWAGSTEGLCLGQSSSPTAVALPHPSPRTIALTHPSQTCAPCIPPTPTPCPVPSLPTLLLIPSFLVPFKPQPSQPHIPLYLSQPHLALYNLPYPSQAYTLPKPMPPYISSSLIPPCIPLVPTLPCSLLGCTQSPMGDTSCGLQTAIIEPIGFQG